LLILHIGTHKTGTSALQAFLKSNADGLQAQGVRYVEAGRPGRLAHHMLAWAIRGRRNTDLSIWDGVRAELRDNPASINVLSTEGFWFEDPARIKEVLDYDGEVKIVAYLRRQDQFLQSLYKQAVSSGRKTDFDAWLAEVPHRGDYLSVLDKWAEAFGIGAITVRPYERGGRTIDAVEDFLSVFGIDPHAMPQIKLSHAHNPSPRRELLHFLRAFNQLNLKIDYEKFFFSVIRRNKAYVRSIDLLTYEQRRVLLDNYEEENRALAKRYLREDIPLFSALKPSELPQIWTQDDPEYFQLTVDVLDAVVKCVQGEVEIERKKRQKSKAP